MNKTIKRAKGTLLAVQALSVIAACAGTDSDGHSVATDFEWESADELVLEESDSVLVVLPTVRSAPSGKLLVADFSEDQIRLYTASGGLLGHYGRSGRGPGEFQGLVFADHLPSGRVVAVDRTGNGAVLNPSASELQTTFRASLGPVLYNGGVLSDSMIVLAGRYGRPESPLLHLYNLAAQQFEGSFFQAPAGVRNSLLEASLAFVDVAVRRDTVAAIYSHADTVYLFTATGELLERFPVRGTTFVPIPGPFPAPGAPRDQIGAWNRSFSKLTHVWWDLAGDLVIQYRNETPEGPKHALIHLGLHGNRTYDREVPEAVGIVGDRVIFRNPDTLSPNALLATDILH